MGCAVPAGDVPRILGHYGGTTGPLVVCIGGMHGNEPAGVLAAQRVMRVLETTRPPFWGQFVALSGNRAALARRQRFVDEDLNRMWTPERLAGLASPQPSPPASRDEAELRELFETLSALLARCLGPAIVLDLHTTSAAGVPFSVISDTLPNRRLAVNIPAPVILGLEEHLDGTILNHINDCGFLALGFEAGQNDAASSVQHHEAVIWSTLSAAGCLRGTNMGEVCRLRDELGQPSRALPRVFEVRYRHPVVEGDRFFMKPGYRNFQPIDRGVVLATDRNGEIRAPESGFILMPLYQVQGGDGFFLVRPVRPAWLAVAAAARRVGLAAVLPSLPGIRRAPDRPDTLLINPMVARWLPIELLHLLGYRRQRREGTRLVVSRRRHVADGRNWKPHRLR